MDLYHYDNRTGEYLGSRPAREDPLDPGRYLMPAHSTQVAPPSTGVNEVAVFAEGQWVKRADFRGVVYWTAPRDRHEITAIGDVPTPGSTRTTPPSDIAEWDGSQWMEPAPTEADIRAEGARRLEAIASAYRPQERETWHKQISEAKAYDADSQAPTPFLSAMAAQTGETVQEIVTRVLANDAAFTAAAGAVLGAQRAILALDPIPTDYADDSRWP